MCRYSSSLDVIDTFGFIPTGILEPVTVEIEISLFSDFINNNNKMLLSTVTDQSNLTTVTSFSQDVHEYFTDIKKNNIVNSVSKNSLKHDT